MLFKKSVRNKNKESKIQIKSMNVLNNITELQNFSEKQMLKEGESKGNID